jgi:hypothetical protein
MALFANVGGALRRADIVLLAGRDISLRVERCVLNVERSSDFTQG